MLHCHSNENPTPPLAAAPHMSMQSIEESFTRKYHFCMFGSIGRDMDGELKPKPNQNKQKQKNNYNQAATYKPTAFKKRNKNTKQIINQQTKQGKKGRRNFF